MFKLDVGSDFGIPRNVTVSGSKITWLITLHRVPTTITFYSHSLGGDTITITLQPRFVVIRYSLGGDTDNNNTAWVCTL